MYSFKETLNRIENEVSQLRFSKHPQSLYAPIEYILEIGGKRIRPALTLLACNLFNEDVDRAIFPALGIEVFHNFTLLHDDLMDQADKRRNRPTVHKVWNANTAILSGDAMLIYAYQLIAETPSKDLSEVINLFSKTALEICEGQQLDMEFETREDVSVDEYIEMIRLKTAVLLACSLKLGAIIGGASDKDASLLYDFGIQIGLAFQLQDDYLDVYGDTKLFGKNIGGDITSNKKTYMLINAFNMANDMQRKELVSLIGAEKFDRDEKIAAVTRLYNEIGIDKLAQKKIEYYFEQSRKYLDAVNVDSSRKAELALYAQKMMKRKY